MCLFLRVVRFGVIGLFFFIIRCEFVVYSLLVKVIFCWCFLVIDSEDIIVLIFFVFKEGISVFSGFLIKVYCVLICLYSFFVRLILKLINFFCVFFDLKGV